MPDVARISADLERAGIGAIQVRGEGLGVVCAVDLGDVPRALEALKGEGFEMLLDLFCGDGGEDLSVTYHLRSISLDEDVYVRASLPYGGTLPSVWMSYPSALYPEREAAELFGLSLTGHPNPKRLLTSDAVEEPLMLKSTPVRTHEEVRRDG
jgi:NADH:ubiquinone oxidoreductase subunit C